MSTNLVYNLNTNRGSMNIIKDTLKPTPVPLYHDGESGSGNGSGDGYIPPVNELILTVPGSSVFLYFFSDVGSTGKGFNISYWWVWLIDIYKGNGNVYNWTYNFYIRGMTVIVLHVHEHDCLYMVSSNTCNCIVHVQYMVFVYIAC